MSNDIVRVKEQVKDLYEAFSAGNYYTDLLDQFEIIRADIGEYLPKKAVRLPNLTHENLDKFYTLLKEIFAEDNNSLTDEDWRFLLTYRGNRDPVIRDQSLFFHLTNSLKMHAIEPNQIRLIKDLLLEDNSIFYHVLEEENDGIYTRSFSWLYLSAILVEDQNYYHVLDEKDYTDILIKAVTYLLLERDWRGFVEGHGWAHALTHMGNIFEAINNFDLPRAAKLFFFNAIFYAYFTAKIPLAYGESDRLANAITDLTNRDFVYADYILAVFDYWNENYHEIDVPNDYVYWNIFYNQLRLFNSLLLNEELPDNIKNFIENDLR